MVLVYSGRHKEDVRDEREERLSGEDTAVHRPACDLRGWTIAKIARWLNAQRLKVTPPVAVKVKENELLLIYPTCWIKVLLKEENGMCIVDEVLHCMPIEQTFFGSSKVKMMCFPIPG